MGFNDRQPSASRLWAHHSRLASAVVGATCLTLMHGSALAAPPELRPFAPPPPLQLSPLRALPFTDVTGSVPPPVAVDIAVEALVAAKMGIPELGIAPPDLPQVAVVPAHSGLGPSDIDAALESWVSAGNAPTTVGGVQAQSRQATRDAIAAFYRARSNAPLWIEGTRFSAAARSALSRIDRAGEDGLTLRGLAVSVPPAKDATPAELAAAELSLSEAAVVYAQQAGGSRIDPAQINRLIAASRTIPNASDVLTSVADAADAGVVLQGFNPPQAGYAALRRKLAELRQTLPLAAAPIGNGPLLKLGMRDARVPLIRSRFGIGAGPAEPQADPLVYDTKVAAAVADFQRGAGLPASGTLTARTVAALSGGNPARLENELVANMERWRWVPRDLGPDYIAVNVADYSLDLVRAGTVVHHARVVVGKPDHQTPLFSDAMRFIIVNPYWNVPLSIIKKEMLPKLAQDPNYFANHGYEVVQRNGITFVRQPPGEDNALGRIKFMFPNQYSVYLHDTNARALFGKTKRALSHGCVRVDQPFALAEAVLGRDQGWTQQRIQKMIGGGERTINLPAPLPIHILYFTAFVDDRGSLQLRDDVYGYSEKVRLALGLRD